MKQYAQILDNFLTSPNDQTLGDMRKFIFKKNYSTELIEIFSQPSPPIQALNAPQPSHELTYFGQIFFGAQYAKFLPQMIHYILDNEDSIFLENVKLSPHHTLRDEFLNACLFNRGFHRNSFEQNALLYECAKPYISQHFKSNLSQGDLSTASYKEKCLFYLHKNKDDLFLNNYLYHICTNSALKEDMPEFLNKIQSVLDESLNFADPSEITQKGALVAQTINDFSNCHIIQTVQDKIMFTEYASLIYRTLKPFNFEVGFEIRNVILENRLLHFLPQEEDIALARMVGTHSISTYFDQKPFLNFYADLVQSSAALKEKTELDNIIQKISTNTQNHKHKI